MLTIKVRSVPAKGEGQAAPMVADFKQLFNGVKRFVGWNHDPKLGDVVEVLNDKGTRDKIRQGGWVRSSEVVELDVSDPEIAREYRLALAQGDLAPADAETAAWANEGGFALKVGGAPVKFTPPKKEG